MLKECKGDPYFFDRGVDKAKLRGTFHKDTEPVKKRTVKYEETKQQRLIWGAVRDTAWATNVPSQEPTKH